MANSRYTEMEDDYDEEADSDFNAEEVNDEIASTSSEEEEDESGATYRPKKRRRVEKTAKPELDLGERDSGDDEVIGEHLKSQEKQKRKQKRKGNAQPIHLQSENEEQGWRAKTRSMREQEEVAMKKNGIATTAGATIDVDKIWEEMNRPIGMPPPIIELAEGDAPQAPLMSTTQEAIASGSDGRENTPKPEFEETVTILQPYMFAGKRFIKEVRVPKSSLTALNEPVVIQKESSNVLLVTVNDKTIRRPLRRVSRFDPNGNSDAFKKIWSKGQKVKKVNVLTKTAGDWEEHVEAIGDREELDKAAKGKNAYLNRQDFLQTVEQKREEGARLARFKQ